jgi:hypothetical protein
VIETIQSLIGNISSNECLEGNIGVGIRTIQIKEHYLEDTNLILVFEDNSKISIDISEYIKTNGELTEEQIKAINEMVCEISNNGELYITYDDTVLDIDFNIENGELIVEDNEENIEFTINEKKEMEAIY